MNHTVGTVASGAFILKPTGNSGSVIAGYAIGNQLVAGICADSTRVEPTEEALANALLWAGASDVVYAAQIAINLFRGGVMAEWAMNDLEAAIKKATIPAQAKVAA